MLFATKNAGILPAPKEGAEPHHTGGFFMRDFFSLDGPFNKYGGMLADTMILSFLWLVCSIPIITIGAANSALFYVTTRRIAEREGYIVRDFFHAFRVNFVRSTQLWLASLVIIIITIINILNMGALGSMAVVLLPLQILILIQLSFISVFLYPVTARFDMGFRQTIKSCFYMANRHLLTSFMCVTLAVGLTFISLWYIEILVIFVPGVYAMLASHLVMRMLKKYRPEMDKDPFLEVQELEAQKTEERRLQAISTRAAENEDGNHNYPQALDWSTLRDNPQPEEEGNKINDNELQ